MKKSDLNEAKSDVKVIEDNIVNNNNESNESVKSQPWGNYSQLKGSLKSKIEAFKYHYSDMRQRGLMFFVIYGLNNDPL